MSPRAEQPAAAASSMSGMETVLQPSALQSFSFSGVSISSAE